ncbi:MAG TPA: hypothetical protein VF153_06565, partial [Candidatus Limnocylindria bacterium]
MTPGWLTRDRAALLTATLFVLVIGLAIFSRGSIDDELSRDESIYAYAGQQLANGVPPYVSILDAKTPLSSMIAGVAVMAGRAGAGNDLTTIRLTFFVISALTVVAVFLASLALSGSVMGALVAAAAFTTFRGFAFDALGGPDAKTPGVLLAAVCTALLVDRRWLLGGMAAGLAVLVWQPLGLYCVTAVVAAWLAADSGRRTRLALEALGGVLLPIIATCIYFVAVGAFGSFWESAVLLPITGTVRPPEDFGTHVTHIVATILAGYGAGGWILLAGLVALVALVIGAVWARRARLGALQREPLVTVVLLPLLGITAFSLVDFQGYPDVYPFLLYGALGIGAAASALFIALERSSRTPLFARGFASVMLLVILVATWTSYSQPRIESTLLPRQRADADAAAALLGPGERLWSLGNP